MKTNLDIKDYLKASRFFHRTMNFLLGRKLGENEQDELKKYFKDNDPEHDGFLERNVIQKGINLYENKFQVLSKIKKEEYDDMFTSLYYTHEDGRLDYNEFTEAIAKFLELQIE